MLIIIAENCWLASEREKSTVITKLKVNEAQAGSKNASRQLRNTLLLTLLSGAVRTFTGEGRRSRMLLVPRWRVCATRFVRYDLDRTLRKCLRIYAVGAWKIKVAEGVQVQFGSL